MSQRKKFIKLANVLDELSLYDAAKIIDDFLKKSDLQLEMEKEVEIGDDDDDDEKETKKKKITLSFD